MLSLLDRLRIDSADALFAKAFKDRDDYHSIVVEPVLNASADNELWLCFTGFFRFQIALYQAWGVHNLLPKKGKVVLINGPLAIAGFTPHESIMAINALDGVIRDVLAAHPNHALHIFSVSAGTYPGFYFANKYRAKRLIAVAPGPRMGQGIYTSIFSRVLKNKCIAAGFPTWRQYDDVIAAYNQENNVENLPCGSDLLIFGGRCDRVIRNSGTREIARICRRAGKMPVFRNYWFFDHTATGGWLGGLNKLGFDPYLLNGS